MQLMPATAQRYGVRGRRAHGRWRRKLIDPRINIPPARATCAT